MLRHPEQSRSSNGLRHPERSRISGGGRDLACGEGVPSTLAINFPVPTNALLVVHPKFLYFQHQFGL